MSGFIPLIAVALVILGLTILVTRGHRGKRQCPKCGAWCREDAERCRTCGYSFVHPEELSDS